MGTLRQKALAKAIVQNVQNGNKLNKGQLVESVGYDKTTAESKPGEIIGQKGVQEELAELGFSEQSAKEVVGIILASGEKDADRLKAADLIFKVVGSYAPQKLDVETNNVQSSETIQQMAAEVALKLKEKKLNEPDQTGDNTTF